MQTFCNIAGSFERPGDDSAGKSTKDKVDVLVQMWEKIN